MTDPDYRQMEELERERLGKTLAVLTRVALGVSNYTDAFFLAAELGVTNLWPRDLKALADAQLNPAPEQHPPVQYRRKMVAKRGKAKLPSYITDASDPDGITDYDLGMGEHS